MNLNKPLAFCFLVWLSHQTLVGQIVNYDLLKEHGEVQFSNATPVDVTQTNGDPYNNGANPGPYFLYASDAVTPAGTTSTMTEPGGGTQTLTYDAANGKQAYYSSGFLTEADLDSAFPNGTYTIASNSQSSGNLSVGSGSFPNVPQILDVNGNTPTWNGNDLTLDVNADNTLMWAKDTSWSNAIGSHADFELYPLTGGQNLEIQKNDFTGADATSTPTDSYSNTIPAGTLVAGDTYQLVLSYTQLTTLTGSSAGQCGGRPDGSLCDRPGRHSGTIDRRASRPRRLFAGAGPVCAANLRRAVSGKSGNGVVIELGILEEPRVIEQTA